MSILSQNALHFHTSPEQKTRGRSAADNPRGETRRETRKHLLHGLSKSDRLRCHRCAATREETEGKRKRYGSRPEKVKAAVMAWSATSRRRRTKMEIRHNTFLATYILPYLFLLTKNLMREGTELGRGDPGPAGKPKSCSECLRKEKLIPRPPCTPLPLVPPSKAWGVLILSCWS